MAIRIVSDSASNIFSFPGVDYVTVPLKVVVGDREFVDDGTVDIAEMDEALRTTKEKTGSSCPNTFEWQSAFEGADEIFTMSITSALSGAYNSCVQASEEYMQEHPEVKIHNIDSLSAGPGELILIEKLVELVKDGKTFEEIKKEIIEYQKHTHIIFVFGSIMNMAKNGRAPTAVAKLSGLLGIHIIGKASDAGTVEVIDKVRSEKKINKVIMNDLEMSSYNGRKVRIAHFDNPIGADNLKKAILAKFPFADVYVHPQSALCSYYCEKHGMMISYEDSLI